MNKKALIISPYFPPSNAADMQRVRISLPYFKGFGWDAEVVTVDEKHSDMVKDELLVQSIPGDIKVHRVKAFNKSWTSKIGWGSIALRSLWFYMHKVNALLQAQKYDLVYFSTTQFPVCVLGAYWKRKFNIPYVIDMQDPWHSDYYQDKPKELQPPKYWLSYRLNKYLEPIAMRKVDGLISVSGNYIHNLKARYPEIRDIPGATITFGAFEPDVKIAADSQGSFAPLLQA
ncbi:MAG TPA: glycosyltransferase, partial [Mucilaginibacter sp.]